MTPQEISSCSFRQIDTFGTELGKLLTPDRLSVFISSLAFGYLRQTTGLSRGQHHMPPEAMMFVQHMNDCVGVLDAIAHGGISNGHKRQMEG